MKKHFTTFLKSAAMMLVATAFTACSSDVESIDPVVIAPVSEKTVFSSGDDGGTRTSIDNKANFYWEKGDKIWIDGGAAGFEWSSQSNITTAKQAKAKFVVDGTYTGDEYNVLYTGYTGGDTTKTYYNKVTIATLQTQKAWNDGSHLGTSGDCGTGIAYKQTGAPGYKFTIDHKASYLLLYPYVKSNLAGATLEKVEIYSDMSSTYIAGTFPFDFDNGLLNADGTTKTPQTGTGKQLITLNCGTGSGFQLSTTVPDVTSTATTFNHLFVVLAPGLHQLIVKYFIRKPSNERVEFIRDFSVNLYEPNGVYPFIHGLDEAEVVVTSTMEFDQETFYQWGGSEVEVGTTQGSGPAGTPNNTYYTTTYPDHRSLAEATDDFWLDIPTHTEMRMYFSLLERQYIYWDNITYWKLNRPDGTSEMRRGGLWVRKKQYNLGWINGTGSGNRFTPQRGRPAAENIYQYFFLPSFFGVDGTTTYWTRTRESSGTTPATLTRFTRAWSISSSSIIPELMEDYWWRVAGRRPATGNADGSDNTLWWQ